MDSTYILPIVIVIGVLAVFGVVLWATSGFGLFKSANSSDSGSGSGSGGGSGGGFTPLGDLHVCVTQISDWITTAGKAANDGAAGMTGAHVLFYTALEGGIPSACSQLSIQLIDENGNAEVDFKWNNGAFYPSVDVSSYKKITKPDLLMFKIMDTMNSSCDVDSGQGCPDGGLCVCSAARNDCARTHPVEYDSKGNAILPSDWCAKNVPCNGTCYISRGFEVPSVTLNN